MLRVVGLALLLVAGFAVPSAAADGAAGEAAASAAHGGATSHDARPLVVPLQLTRASTGAQWFALGAWSGGFRRDVPPPTAGIAALPLAGPNMDRSPPLPWLEQGKSGLRVPVTERLSFAVGYRRIQGEDLWRRYPDAASVDYDSHDFLLRAHWRF